MKTFQRIFCLTLAMSVIFVLPGMAQIVSAAKSEITSMAQNKESFISTEENTIAAQALRGNLPEYDLSENYQSGILKQTPLSDEERSITLATSSETQNAPDMMYALRKVNPVFSIKNNSNETIDLNTGSL